MRWQICEYMRQAHKGDHKKGGQRGIPKGYPVLRYLWSKYTFYRVIYMELFYHVTIQSHMWFLRRYVEFKKYYWKLFKFSFFSKKWNLKSNQRRQGQQRRRQGQQRRWQISQKENSKRWSYRKRFKSHTHPFGIVTLVLTCRAKETLCCCWRQMRWCWS